MFVAGKCVVYLIIHLCLMKLPCPVCVNDILDSLVNIKFILFKIVKNKLKHIYLVNSFHMMFNNHKAPKNGSV